MQQIRYFGACILHAQSRLFWKAKMRESCEAAAVESKRVEEERRRDAEEEVDIVEEFMAVEHQLACEKAHGGPADDDDDDPYPGGADCYYESLEEFDNWLRRQRAAERAADAHAVHPDRHVRGLVRELAEPSEERIDVDGRRRGAAGADAGPGGRARWHR